MSRHLIPLTLLPIILSSHAQPQTKATGSAKWIAVDYLQAAAGTSIFIYDGGVKPCSPLQPGQRVEPTGSGFVVGIADTTATTNRFHGWKFLITAEHVVHDKSDLVLRLNRTDKQGKVCFSLHLVRTGTNENFFFIR